MELNVQKYLRNGKTLADLELDLGIKSSEYGNLVILNYSQIDSPKNHPIVMECRQLVLEKGTWNIIHMAMKRFFNYGEALELTADFDYSRAVALDKIDGCCDANTVIETEDGPKTIREICEEKYYGKIKAFDLETEEECLTPVEGHSIQDNNDDWYEIELEEGSSIRLTGNHKVYLPEFGCYREVKNLQGDEGILLLR